MDSILGSIALKQERLSSSDLGLSKHYLETASIEWKNALKKHYEEGEWETDLPEHFTNKP